MNLPEITRRYNEKCATVSDINQLLPFLHYYAKKCKHITEMGVRAPTSTYAFLAANPETVIGYDIARLPGVDEVDALASDVFTFIQQDVLQTDIAETEFLFIDTYHTATQLERELAKHAGKAKRYIGFHDTTSFWEVGEQAYPGISRDIACGRGLKYAIIPFLNKGGWKIAFTTDISNGLLIIERNARGTAYLKQLFTHLKYDPFIRYRFLKRVKNRLIRLFAIS